MTNPKYFICAILFSSLILAGCATKQSAPVKVHYYPKCHEPLAYLQQRSGGYGNAAAAGAIQGGVISGIAGAIISVIAGGRPAGVLAGIGAGATIGGLTSAANRYSVNEKEDAKRLATYLEQIDGDISGMDIVTAAATVSSQCYGKEFQQLLANMKESKISPQAARQRFSEILAGREETAKLLGKESDTATLEQEFRDNGGTL